MSEIKKKYREKVKDFHPDNVIGKGLPEEYKEFAEQKFKQIQDAFEKIKQHRRG